MSLLKGSAVCVTLGDHPVLRGVDIELRSGELLGLIGPNGAGKSTLLRALAGLQVLHGGAVALDGVPLERSGPQLRARAMAYLAQNGEAHWPIEVERLVALGRTPHLTPWQRPGDKDRAAVLRALEQTDTLGLRERLFTTLSGGERMRVLLARALAVQPRVILADEPVAALDPAHQLEVMALLRAHCEGGGAALVVLHDLTLGGHFCHRLQLLHQGRALAEGRPDEVLTRENLERAYGITPTTANVIDAFRLNWRAHRAPRTTD
ncbi:MAG: ABC transporter ATP-binding protein [gamma proteobacterium symbiont of Phacoides pectinatus]